MGKSDKIQIRGLRGRDERVCRNVRVGGIERGSRALSKWWGEICEIYRDERGKGLAREIKRLVENGGDTLFWRDAWVESEPLCKKIQ